MLLLATSMATWLAFAALLLGGALAIGLPTLEQVAAFDLGTLGPLFLRDIGRDLLPLSLAVAVLLWSRRWHRHALLQALASALYLVVGCHRTATLGDDGSWGLALVVPAALLVAQSCSRRTTLALLLAAMALTGTKLWLRSERSAAEAFVGGLRQVAAHGPYAIVSGPRRDEAFLRARWPELAAVRVAAICSPADERAPAAVVAELAGMVRDGRRLLLTAEAETALRDPAFRARHPRAIALLRELEAAFRSEFVAAGGFQGSLLVPR